MPCGGLQRGSCDNHVLGARWRNGKSCPGKCVFREVFFDWKVLPGGSDKHLTTSGVAHARHSLEHGGVMGAVVGAREAGCVSLLAAVGCRGWCGVVTMVGSCGGALLGLHTVQDLLKRQP